MKNPADEPSMTHLRGWIRDSSYCGYCLDPASVNPQLARYIDQYRQDLFESVIPFWQRHSLDREYGGYFSCLDRQGNVYDTRKYIWPQGREVWMFSRLYNEVAQDPAYLDAAKLGINFIQRHAFDEKGRPYFSLTREGKPFFFQRKPYAAVFVMMGMLEYGRATNDQSLIRQADELFWKIGKWIDEPALLDRPVLAGQPRTSGLANVMVMASMALELAAVNDRPEYRRVMREALANVGRHYDAKRRIFVENVPLDPTVNITDWPEGRLFSPGHSIEVAWFVLHLLEYEPDEKLKQMALDVLEGSLQFGWDREHEGLFYFMDVEGRPAAQLEWDMKLWWPHSEAIYALVLAYKLTGEQRWLDWLERVHNYSYRCFADPEFGEWFGYCNRYGEPTHLSKGSSYKGFFHIPRALLFSIQRAEE